MNPYSFPVIGFTLRETPDGVEVACDSCTFHPCYGRHAKPGNIGTDLLLHRLKCETGPVNGEFIFASDLWNPQVENWPAYENRIRRAFNQSLIESGIASPVQDISFAN